MWGSSTSGSAATRWYKALTYNDVHPNTRFSDLLRAFHRIGLIVVRPARHRKVALCLRDERLAAFMTRQPQLPFKYLRRNYLASNLDRRRRACILTFHFSYLASRLPRDVIQAVARDGVCLWASSGTSKAHQVRLAVPDPVDNEGELALEYVLDGQTIYIVSFTFVPLSLFGLPGHAAALISRVQANGIDVVTLREAAKETGDIAPRHVLIFAMQGVSLALGQDRILAVSVANHTVSKTHAGAIAPASYDELFDALGGVRRQDGIYHLSVPFEEQEPAQSTSSHRRRARQRRAGRHSISEQVRQAATALITPRDTAGLPCAPANVLGHAVAEVACSRAE